MKRQSPGQSSEPSVSRWLAGGGLLVCLFVVLSLPATAQGATEDPAAGSWLSILPPVLAIGLALLFRDVLLALVVAVGSGALIVAGGQPFVAFSRTIDGYIVPALADSDHASILVFSSLLGAMVGIVSRCGGAAGIVEWLRPYANSRRRGQLATWWMGVLIFFDDYANTLIVGPTMRPITDRLRISREKLAYIVDSTAAPIAALIPISTWVGFEIGLIQDAFSSVGLDRDGFAALLASIPYRSYSFLALILGFAIAWLGRDFGPMRRAEQRALEAGQLVADGEEPLADFSATPVTTTGPHRARNAILPIATVVAVTVMGLFVTGRAALLENGQSRDSFEGLATWIRELVSASNSYKALLWASLAGVSVAFLLAVGQRILSIREASEALVEGIKAMLMAFLVLILAWSLGAVCGDLGTAGFLVQVTNGVLAPGLLPALLFVLAAAVAFSTGTSWGTMAILIPLAIPLADNLSQQAGVLEGSQLYEAVLLGTIGSILAGAVWGDHCSPISDTTILSSMASGCNHLAHVRSQVPYALVAGGAALVFGYLPGGVGLNPWLGLLIGATSLVALLYWVGTPLGDGPTLDTATQPDIA